MQCILCASVVDDVDELRWMVIDGLWSKIVLVLFWFFPAQILLGKWSVNILTMISKCDIITWYHGTLLWRQSEWALIINERFSLIWWLRSRFYGGCFFMAHRCFKREETIIVWPSFENCLQRFKDAGVPCSMSDVHVSVRKVFLTVLKGSVCQILA